MQSTVPGKLRGEMEVMQFEPGVSGNPNGRPKGSSGGRVQALAALDVMLGKKKNQRALVKALQDEFMGDPVRFFKTVIMPLLPREAKLSFDHDGVIRWQSLLGPDAEQRDEGGGLGPELGGGGSDGAEDGACLEAEVERVDSGRALPGDGVTSGLSLFRPRSRGLK